MIVWNNTKLTSPIIGTQSQLSAKTINYICRPHAILYQQLNMSWNYAITHLATLIHAKRRLCVPFSTILPLLCDECSQWTWIKKAQAMFSPTTIANARATLWVTNCSTTFCRYATSSRTRPLLHLATISLCINAQLSGKARRWCATKIKYKTGITCDDGLRKHQTAKRITWGDSERLR